MIWFLFLHNILYEFRLYGVFLGINTALQLLLSTKVKILKKYKQITRNNVIEVLDKTRKKYFGEIYLKTIFPNRYR